MSQLRNPLRKKVKTQSPIQKPSTSVVDFLSEVHIEEGDVSKEPHYIPRIKCTHTLRTKHEYVFWGGVCYVDDKKHLVSGGSEGNLFVWDVVSKELLHTKHINSKVYKVIYIKGKRVILATSDDGSVSIFDVDRNYSLRVAYQAHPKQAFSVNYLPNFDLIASCGEEGNITLWTYDEDHNDCSKKRTLDTNKKQVSSLCYVEDQDLLVAGMLKGGYLMIFNPEKSKPIKVAKAHQKERSVDSLIYLPEWRQVISGSEDSYIKFWDFSDLKSSNFPSCLKALRRDNSFIESIAIIPDKNYLFHTNLDECFSVWDLSKDKLMENIKGHSDAQRGEALFYLKDRKELVTPITDEIRFLKKEFIQDQQY
jgi:WD40 repeat protein